MNVKFCLALPCEAVSVPVIRRVLGDTLRNLGVVDECVGDILVAVTEACTNVLRHGGSARRYEVVTNVGPSGCLVEVVDSGQGFSPAAAAAAARADGHHAVQPAGRTGSRDARAQTPAPAAQDPARTAQRAAGGRKAGQPKAGQPTAGQLTAGQAKAQPRAAQPKDGVRRPERAAQRRTAPGTAGRPHGSRPSARRVDDRVIARLPESGRGLQIMRALVDDVTLKSGPGCGTVVSMRKQVAWRRDAPLTGLSRRKLRDVG